MFEDDKELYNEFEYMLNSNPNAYVNLRRRVDRLTEHYLLQLETLEKDYDRQDEVVSLIGKMLRDTYEDIKNINQSVPPQGRAIRMRINKYLDNKNKKG